MQLIGVLMLNLWQNSNFRRSETTLRYNQQNVTLQRKYNETLFCRGEVIPGPISTLRRSFSIYGLLCHHLSFMKRVVVTIR